MTSRFVRHGGLRDAAHGLRRATGPPGLAADRGPPKRTRQPARRGSPAPALEPAGPGRRCPTAATAAAAASTGSRTATTFEVGLSAPVTRQSWRLAGDRTAARLEGLDGGPREGVDAAELLREATGWEIPVTALSAWVRGARAEGLGVARMQFGADGRLSRIEQGGWTIDYSDWVPEPGLGIELPDRLNAARDQAKVRLIVDAWSDGMAQP